MELAEQKRLSKLYAQEWGFSTTNDEKHVAFWGDTEGDKESVIPRIKELNDKLVEKFNRTDLEFILVHEVPPYNAARREWGLMLTEKVETQAHNCLLD